MNTERNPVGWFEIYVQDMARAKAFYEAMLGTRLESLEDAPGGLEMQTFPMGGDKPGATGALVRMQDKDSGVGGTLVYFSCDDCAEEAARAAKNGGRVHQEKMPIGEYGFIALVRDPDGNMVGLHSMK